jgi:hypothetical protein
MVISDLRFRFGPDVLKWKECTTMREYLRRGLLTSSLYHIVTGAGLILFSAIGRPSPVAAVSTNAYVHFSS